MDELARGWTPSTSYVGIRDALDGSSRSAARTSSARAREVCADARARACRSTRSCRRSPAARRRACRWRRSCSSRFDVLCLDEPTNDLDFDGLERLERFVQGFDGSVVLVSHDRAFLDRTVTRIVAFEAETRKVTRVRRERTSDYERERALALDAAGARVRRLRRGARPLRHRCSASGAAAGAARASSSADRADAGAPTRRCAGRAAARAARGGREAVAAVAAAARARAALAQRRRRRAPLGRGGRARHVPARAARRRASAGATASRSSAANGAGKTTLLRALTGELPLARGTRDVGSGVVLGELDQRARAVRRRRAPAGRLSRASSLRTADARTLLAKFGIRGDDALRPAGSLSPGERSARAARAAPGARRQLPDPRRADEPPRPRGDRAARGGARRLRGNRAARVPRPALPRTLRADADDRSLGSPPQREEAADRDDRCGEHEGRGDHGRMLRGEAARVGPRLEARVRRLAS